MWNDTCDRAAVNLEMGGLSKGSSKHLPERQGELFGGADPGRGQLTSPLEDKGNGGYEKGEGTVTATEGRHRDRCSYTAW